MGVHIVNLEEPISSPECLHRSQVNTIPIPGAGGEFMNARYEPIALTRSCCRPADYHDILRLPRDFSL